MDFNLINNFIDDDTTDVMSLEGKHIWVTQAGGELREENLFWQHSMCARSLAGIFGAVVTQSPDQYSNKFSQ